MKATLKRTGKRGVCPRPSSPAFPAFSNPYGSQVDYAYYGKTLPQWRIQILNLLNNHKIKLVGETIFYLVHMKENQDDKVHYYKFGPLQP
jgi:hypothetical protein